MAEKIRKWIASGRPKPGQEKKVEKVESAEELEEEPEEEDKVKEKEEKPKKKGLFGWLKK